MSGELKIEDLDDRELQRGQLMNRNGTFSGRPSKMIPRKFALAAQEEYKRRITLMMQEMIPDAMKSLHMSVKYGDDVAAPRLPAVKEVLERTIGKVTDKKEIAATVRHEEIQTKLLGYLVPVEDAEDAVSSAPRRIKVKRLKQVEAATQTEDIIEAEVIEE